MCTCLQGRCSACCTCVRYLFISFSCFNWACVCVCVRGRPCCCVCGWHMRASGVVWIMSHLMVWLRALSQPHRRARAHTHAHKNTYTMILACAHGLVNLRHKFSYFVKFVRLKKKIQLDSELWVFFLACCRNDG